MSVVVASLRAMTDPDVASQVQRLREQLAQDPVDPPAGWPAVEAFEARHGVVLPEPFRTFTATVTSGGTDCGPEGYDLRTLADDLPGPPLGDPFPLTEAWIWCDGDEGPAGVADDDAFGGLLPLGAESDWFLVVTGAHRGHVWQVTDDGAQPFGREFGHTTAASGFLGWVEHWHAQTKEFGEVDWWDADTATWDLEPAADVEPPAPPEPGGLPVLTPAQRHEAVRRGRVAWHAHRQAWRSIARGETTLSAVLDLAEGGHVVGSALISSLLWALPGLRRGDVDAVLEEAGIPRRRRVKGVQGRSRQALLDVLERRLGHPV
jgi:hypothetical protein